MVYLITFLEGIITFISPCLLPMLPVYALYFTGGGTGRRRDGVLNALGFVAGFTAVFVLLGAAAGGLGSLLHFRYAGLVNIVTGLVVVALGLGYLGLFRLPFAGLAGRAAGGKKRGFFSSLLFGAVFSVGWTPCIGAFLGSAIMLAANEGSALGGMLLLLAYSLGLGVPFFLGALLIDRAKGAFDFIKKHYAVINRAAGALLVVLGILMMTGLWGRLIASAGI